MNLVMIGHFESSDDAEQTHKLIEKLSNELSGKVDIGTSPEHYPDDVAEVLRKNNCYILSPGELEHFLYDIRTCVKGDRIVLTTDEVEVSAFFKLMIDKGAKVEMFSAHYHPNEQYGRGK